MEEFIPKDEPMLGYHDLEVPEAAEDYDPLHIQDFEIPNFDLYDIEEVEQLQDEEIPKVVALGRQVTEQSESQSDNSVFDDNNFAAE